MSQAASSSGVPPFVKKKGRYDRSLKANVVSIFDCPPDFQETLNSVVKSTAGGVENVTEQLQQASVGSGYPTTEAVPKKAEGKHFCSKSNVWFETAEEFREHVKSDWYVANVKLAVQGKPPLSKEEFEAIKESLEEESKQKEENQESDDEDDDSESEAETEESEEEEENLNALAEDGSRRALVHGLVFRCWDIPSSYTLALPACVNDHVSSLPAYFGKCQEDHVGVILLRSGRFAGAVYAGSKLVYHRTKKRYTVRAKAGGAQSAHDTSVGKARSAGAMLRRYGEKAMSDDLQEIFSQGEFASGLKTCSRIYLSVGRSLKHLITQTGSVLAKEANPPPMIRLPVPVQRPTIEAATSAFQQIHSFVFAEQSGWQMVVEKSKPEPKQKQPKDVDKKVQEVKIEQITDETDEYFSDLHRAAQNADVAKILELLDSGGNPAIQDMRGRKPYQLAQTKAGRDAFRTWRGLHENDDLEFTWEDSLIPDGITEDTLAAKQAKEKEKQAKKKARQKAKKAEEKAKLEAEKKKQEEEEAKRKAAHPEQKCDNCGKPLPKKPFYALNFAYCSTECVKEHKRKLQLARFG